MSSKDVEETIDLMENERGESSDKRDGSARAKFNLYLAKHVDKWMTITQLTAAHVTEELIEKLATFLYNDPANIAQLPEFYPSTARETDQDRSFPSQCRLVQAIPPHLAQAISHAVNQDRQEAERAGSSYDSERSHCDFADVVSAQRTTLMDRTLLSKQRMVMGRSSNIGTLTFNDFQWLDHYILVDVARLKISDVHHVSVFCSPGLWAIDPLHSLACQMVTTPYSSSNQVFPQISSQPERPEHRVAAYINRVLKSVYETEQPDKITPNLQSQSTRRGGAAFASSNHHVNLSDLAHRGHWTMDGFATLLEYISPTSSSDQTIGKVLGGWHDPKSAGLPPTLNAFSSEPRDVAANVRAFADYLRVRHFSRLNKASFADALTASLLMYLPDTLQVVRNNVVHNEILQVASQVLPDAIDLQGELIRWGRVIKRRFIMDNMQALPVAHIKENLSEREQAEHLINPRTYGEVLERLVIGQQQLFHRQEQIMSMLQDLMRAPRSFECSQSHETTAPSQSKVKKAKAINALAKLQQAKLWPESLSTLKERALSDVLIQVFLVQLHHLLKETGNRAQTDVIKAVDIAEQLADIRSIPPYPDAGDSHRQKEWMDTMRAMANEIERLVLECLEAEKASDPTRQRKRKHTAYINGIVRAWGRRQKKRQRLPSREGRIQFAAFQQS